MQNYEIKKQKIRDAFLKLKKENPSRLKNRLKLSWSNWGFGIEPLDVSCERLAKAGVRYIELHGNHYGNDLGYRLDDTRKILEKHGIKAAGICGMFSADSDLSSNKAGHRQTAIDYLKREIPFCAGIGGSYILVVPGAVGRNRAYDDVEFERSVETLSIVADMFTEYKVRAAIEPIRSAEVSFIHTVADAKRYIDAVNHPGVKHINGDLYHMQSEESHIGEAILDAGDMLINLHLADSNRCALGEGSLDIDTVIMTLYLIGYNEGERYVTPEPLGPGGDPYPAMYGRPDPKKLDELVKKTVCYFRQREEELL
ncbi:MAG: sugar phosphate isomerase/epimerase [Treponema sp.]|jgi:sugar phosphate isomerase/epimerase|nr:sugar phosphate isomerase/epimerase [Treponema sp.]